MQVVGVDVRLRPVRIGDELVIRTAQRELAKDDFEFAFGLEDNTDWPAYVQRLDEQRRGLSVPAGSVAATFLVAVVDGDIVGRTSIRHELNDYLTRFGGHIGYGIRPQFRRRGYAVEVLRQSLVIARSIGVDDVLLTCDDDNVGSSRVIECCGGILETVTAGPAGTPLRRYWMR